MIDELVRIHHAGYQEDLPFWLSLTKGRDPVLELGCGHGRVSIFLAREGRRLVGLDHDPEALAALRAYWEGGHGPGLELVLADMLALPFQARFGAVIIPCNTYSTLSAEERKRLLAGTMRLLPPGGILAASLPNPDLMLEIHREITGSSPDQEPEIEAVFSHPKTGNPVQVSSRLHPVPDGLAWEWIYDHLQPDGRVERLIRTTQHKLASLEIYQAEILDAGYAGIIVQGDFGGNPYRKDSPYLIWQAAAV